MGDTWTGGEGGAQGGVATGFGGWNRRTQTMVAPWRGPHSSPPLCPPQVRYMKIIEKSGYQALPWVRYITQSGGALGPPPKHRGPRRSAQPPSSPPLSPQITSCAPPEDPGSHNPTDPPQPPRGPPPSQGFPIKPTAVTALFPPFCSGFIWGGGDDSRAMFRIPNPAPLHPPKHRSQSAAGPRGGRGLWRGWGPTRGRFKRGGERK